MKSRTNFARIVMKKIAILGFGGRGTGYAYHCKRMKKDFQITAVIDTSPEKLDLARKVFGIPEEGLFPSLEAFLKSPKTADWLFVCTQDKYHVVHAIPAMRHGYNLLLEKPVACSVEDCLEIEKVAEECNVRVAVCHVLRYSEYYAKIKNVIDSGALGRIIAIDQVENVGYWHQAHSFVRGDWRNAEESNPMILAKCCHDLDIAVYLSGSRCMRVSSQGELNFFKKENAPTGSTEYCLGGCKVKKDCPYDCEKLYIGPMKGKPWFAVRYLWPQCRLVNDGVASVKKVYEALRTTDFGKCVFRSDNDVVDYQVTTMLFENGINATLTMTAFSERVYRETRVRGTLGDLKCDMSKGTLELRIFGKKAKVIKLKNRKDPHSGGDEGLIRALAKDEIRTDISQSIKSHLIGFAAERSRKNNGVPVQLSEIRKA